MAASCCFACRQAVPSLTTAGLPMDEGCSGLNGQRGRCHLIQAATLLPLPLPATRVPLAPTQGYTRVRNTTFASFGGANACGSSASVGDGGVFALSNHHKLPDAFHPVDFAGVVLQNVATG